MAKKTAQLHTWNGYPIHDPDHAHDLNQMAFIKQNSGELNPKTGQPYTGPEANHAAYHQHRADQLRRHAAHHYAGMKLAQAVGDNQALFEHKSLYNEALKLMDQHHVENGGQPGTYNPNGAVPPDVAMHVHPNYSMLYKFKSHPADDLVLSGWKGAANPVPEMPQTVYDPATKAEKITTLVAELKKMVAKL